MSSAKEKHAEEEGGGESAPLWIISFADMISLLMAFFVMLSSFNSFDKQEKEKLDATFRATLMECGGWLTMPPNNNSLSPGLSDGENVTEGPETRPVEETQKNGKITRTDSKGYFTDRTFLVSTDFLFYSSGAALTANGRQWLDNLAVYLTRMTGQILIAEQKTAQIKTPAPLRAVAVAEYLVSKNIDSGRISIGTQGTSSDSLVQQDQALEISLLEKDICP
jgi:outer membrane protein OmpA-like peptidoglycan-associated protein